MFRSLSRLTHLSELLLYFDDLSERNQDQLPPLAIDQARQAPIHRLPSVRVLRLRNISLRDTELTGTTFSRLLSDMFPSLHKLDVKFSDDDDEVYLTAHLNVLQVHYLTTISFPPFRTSPPFPWTRLLNLTLSRTPPSWDFQI